MTHIDIHIIINGSHCLVGIMKVAWEVILSIFHVESLLPAKKVIAPVVKTATVLASRVIQALVGLLFFYTAC